VIVSYLTTSPLNSLRFFPFFPSGSWCGLIFTSAFFSFDFIFEQGLCVRKAAEVCLQLEPTSPRSALYPVSLARTSLVPNSFFRTAFFFWLFFPKPFLGAANHAFPRTGFLWAIFIPFLLFPPSVFPRFFLYVNWSSEFFPFSLSSYTFFLINKV